MFDDLAAFYHDHVVTEYAEYLSTYSSKIMGLSQDMRRALAAASALFHLREHLPAPQMSRGAVERLCPDYGLLGDVVNASKHGSVTQPTPHGAPLIAQA